MGVDGACFGRRAQIPVWALRDWMSAQNYIRRKKLRRD